VFQHCYEIGNQEQIVLKNQDKIIKKTASPRKRDAVATRAILLKAALTEFCEKGFSGARTSDIAELAGCNIRMLYHYFGSKEGAYLAALEHVYEQVRSHEESLDLLHLDPVEGIVALIEFTHDYMVSHQEFIRMMGIENIHHGKFLRQSKSVPQAAMPLMDSIKALLERGQVQGVFRKNVDPLQLYVSILSLCYLHSSNKYTLSITFGEDLTDANWLTERRKHAREMILCFLMEK
jgi:TetR/AcrR family transcriptional regulator